MSERKIFKDVDGRIVAELQAQLDAADKRIAELSGELAFMRDDRNLYYAMAKRQTGAIEEFSAHIAELEAKLEAIKAIVHRWIDSEQGSSPDSMLKVLEVLYPPHAKETNK